MLSLIQQLSALVRKTGSFGRTVPWEIVGPCWKSTRGLLLAGLGEGTLLSRDCSSQVATGDLRRLRAV